MDLSHARRAVPARLRDAAARLWWLCPLRPGTVRAEELPLAPLAKAAIRGHGVIAVKPRRGIGGHTAELPKFLWVSKASTSGIQAEYKGAPPYLLRSRSRASGSDRKSTRLNSTRLN